MGEYTGQIMYDSPYRSPSALCQEKDENFGKIKGGNFLLPPLRISYCN